MNKKKSKIKKQRNMIALLAWDRNSGAHGPSPRSIRRAERAKLKKETQQEQFE